MMQEKTIYALGFFDGVHMGHQALLTACAALAREKGLTPGAATFAAHPDTLVLHETPGLINTLADRERLLRRFGMERVVILPFDDAMRRLPWKEFLEGMRRDHGAAGFVCGADFRFGYKGEGTAQALAEACREWGLPWAVVPEQTLDGLRVSSTHIRTLLAAGDMENACRFLGHPHMLTGTVVPGQGLGRKWGVPTANLELPDLLAVPRFGAYVCLARVAGQSCPAVTNIGTRPTVSGRGITVESWLLDYSGDLYGRELTLEFFAFLRPERAFSRVEELKAQIGKDGLLAREILSRRP